MVMSPVGVRTNNHCAFEDQQKFSSQAVSEPTVQDELCDGRQPVTTQERAEESPLSGTVIEQRLMNAMTEEDSVCCSEKSSAQISDSIISTCNYKF
jgi:hypothetical protein